MTRLIVEEGGKRRRFRLNPGKLSIGSGEQAALRLSSEDVAAVHAVLEFDGEQATLHLEAGVAPVQMGGRSRSGSIGLKLGQALTMGGAKLTVGSDEEAAPEAPRSRSGVSKKGSATRGRTAQRATSSRTSEDRGRSAEGGKSRVKRSAARTQKTSVPTWLIIVIGLAGAAFVINRLDSFADTSSERGFSALASQGRIEDKLTNMDFKGALAEIEWVNEHRSELDANWRKVFDEAEKRAIVMREEGQLYSRNATGTKVFAGQLEKFPGSYLKNNTRPEARVFLKRIAQFRSDYPRHPELPWCDRMVERYAGIAKLSEPPTLADVAFEVKALTWTRPRDYKEAFKQLNSFLATANEDDRSAAMALINEKETEREAFFDDRMQQAAYFFWDRKQPSKAVAELAQLVAMIGDPAMEDLAVDSLIVIPDLDGYLRTYRKDRVSRFAALMDNARLKAYADNNNVF